MQSSELKVKSDIQQWTWSLRESIEKFISSFGEHIQIVKEQDFDDALKQQKLSSFGRLADEIISVAHQWYKSINQTGLPRDVRKEINRVISKQVEEKVINIHNIKEHWESNRKYFEDLKVSVPPDKKSVKWFRQNFPQKTPWSLGWSNETGFTICGALNIQELLTEIEKVEKILPEITGNLYASN